MMLLEQRLNLVLTQKNLAPDAPAELTKFCVQRSQINVFKSLEDGIKSIKTIEPDENGVRVIVTENLNVDKLDVPITLLPAQLGDCIIQNIRKNKEGYEVHVIN